MTNAEAPRQLVPIELIKNFALRRRGEIELSNLINNTPAINRPEIFRQIIIESAAAMQAGQVKTGRVRTMISYIMRMDDSRDFYLEPIPKFKPKKLSRHGQLGISEEEENEVTEKQLENDLSRTFGQTNRALTSIRDDESTCHLFQGIVESMSATSIARINPEFAECALPEQMSIIIRSKTSKMSYLRRKTHQFYDTDDFEYQAILNSQNVTTRESRKTGIRTDRSARLDKLEEDLETLLQFMLDREEECETDLHLPLKYRNYCQRVLEDLGKTYLEKYQHPLSRSQDSHDPLVEIGYFAVRNEIGIQFVCAFPTYFPEPLVRHIHRVR